MFEQCPPRVFVSYRHEPDRPEHGDRVLALADRLRAAGVDAIIDQYETAPPEGWPTWCEREIERANFVLMVCTEAFHRTLRGEIPQGEGHGVLWEARLIRQLIYDTGSETAKFIPVLFADGVAEHVPLPLRGATRHWIDTAEGYEDLYRQLTDEPRARKKELGPLEKLPERARQWRVQAVGALHGVPELPPHFVARSDEVAALAGKLLATNGSPVGATGVATKVGVQGMGGIGKSVLAVAAVRDDAVRAAFPGGIFWLALGQEPDLLTRQASLFSLLTGEPATFADAQDARLKLQEALRGRTCLVVLDDVWRLADAEAFNVVDTEARLLLTTRDGAIVRKLSAREHEVGRLDRPQSLRLLAETARVAEADLPVEADAIARECGDLPLALALSGGTIRGQANRWRPVLDALRKADLERLKGEFSGYPYANVFAAIEASVTDLGADEERYLDLAIFPEYVAIPESALEALWSDVGGDPLQVGARTDLFRDRSLIHIAPDGSLGLHDLLRDFVRKRASDLPGRHFRLVEAWRKQCRDGWAEGPTDQYFFRHLPLHLNQADLTDELRNLLLDPRWIAAKLAVTDMASLLSDYKQATDPEVVLVGRALMLSANVIGGDPGQLPFQLTGRLQGVGGDGIARLLAAAGAPQGLARLRPRTRSLTPPGPELRRFDGHEKGVTSVAVLADGRRALSGSEDGTLRLWDLESGAELRRFEGHGGWVTSVAVLADGRRALSGSSDQTLLLWDVETGAELRRFEGHKESVASVAVLADGRRALSGSSDQTLRLWDLESGAEFRRFDGHEAEVTSVAVLADGRRALSGSDDRTLRLWDLESGAELRRFEGHSRVTSVAVLADGRRALTGYWDGTLRLWDLATGAELRRFEGHKESVASVAVLADGRRALSSSWDKTLRLWDLESGAELRRFEGHESFVTSVAVLADGRRALSGSYDRTLRLWDLATGAEFRRFEGHESFVTSVAVLANGRRALSGSYDRTLRLWDLATGAEFRRFDGHEAEVTSVAVLADGRRALSGSYDRTLRLWDLATGAEFRRFDGHEAEVTSVAVLADGRRALSGSDDRTLRLWDLESGAELRLFEGHSRVTSVAVLADGRRALTGYWDGTLRLWDLESGAKLRRFEGHEARVTSVAVLADGRRALSGSRDKTLRLWDLESGAELRRFVGHESVVTSVAVLADGRRALSGSDDRTLRLWDLATGATLAVFTGDAAITAAAVARGDLFVAGSGNGAIHILELIEPKLA